MEKAQELATRKGGRLIKYGGTKRSLWECSNGHQFQLTYYKVNRRGKWCSTCGASVGERMVRQILQHYQIPFRQQVTLPNLTGRWYDFYFQYAGKHFLLEYDGEQHFQYVRKYHKTKAKFLENQQVDKIKTQTALASGYNIIRIDYSKRDYIWHHFCYALQMNWQLYLSTPQLYSFLYA